MGIGIFHEGYFAVWRIRYSDADFLQSWAKKHY
jgi:hypothetical protein